MADHPEPAISPEDAQRILKADLANVVAKVKAKRVLSDADRRVLAKASGEDQGWAKNKVELAAALNVDRRTVNNWCKRRGAPKPRANGHHDLAAWRKFAATLPTQQSSGESKSDLESRKLALQIAQLERDAARDTRSLVPRADAEADLVSLASMVRSALESLPLRLAAALRVEGVEAEARKVVDDTLSRLAGEVEASAQRLEAPDAG